MDGSEAFVDTTRIFRNKWSVLQVDADWSALSFERQQRKVGIEKFGERKLNEKKGGETNFDEHLKGQVQHRMQVPACSADAMRICRERVEGASAGSSTLCSVKYRVVG